MIRAALVGVSTVVGVGAVLAFQPADIAEVAGAAPAAAPSTVSVGDRPEGVDPTAPSPGSSAGAATASSTAPTGSSGSPDGPGPASAQATPGGTAPGGAPPAPTSSRRASASPSSAPQPSKPSRSATATPSATQTATPAATPTTTTASPSSPPSSSGPHTWTGAVAITPYGNVQVALVVDAGVITDAYALQFPSEHPTSVEIASYALPELRRQTLEAQSARISGVSGASYDTVGWITSLQSALSRADL